MKTYHVKMISPEFGNGSFTRSVRHAQIKWGKKDEGEPPFFAPFFSLTDQQSKNGAKNEGYGNVSCSQKTVLWRKMKLQEIET